VIKQWFPFILKYPNTVPSQPSVVQTVDQVTVNNCPEITDDIWIDPQLVLKKFPSMPKPSLQTGQQFVMQLIMSLLGDFGFAMPLPAAVKLDLNWC
jgi:hypothetical protein